EPSQAELIACSRTSDLLTPAGVGRATPRLPAESGAGSQGSRRPPLLRHLASRRPACRRFGNTGWADSGSPPKGALRRNGPAGKLDRVLTSRTMSLYGLHRFEYSG